MSDGNSGASPEVASRGGRLDFLDAIRGIGALLVVLSHALEALQPVAYGNLARHSVELGRVGITAFFLVSGYVVGLTLSTQSPRTFAVRRFWRLYPIYWLSALLSVAVWLLLGNSFDHNLGPLVIILNVLMVQGFLSTYSILVPAWTLGIEIAFYAQSVFAKLVRQLARSSWLGYFWLAAYGALSVSNWLRGTTYSAVVPLMMFTASLGFAIFQWDRRRDRSVFPLLASALVVVPLFGTALGTQSEHPGVWPAIEFNLSYEVGLVVFFIFYAMRRWSMPRWLLWLGAVSYSLYLIHLTVFQLVALTPIWEASTFLALPAAVAASLVAARLLHVFVERPMTAFGRKLTPSRRPLPKAASH